MATLAAPWRAVAPMLCAASICTLIVLVNGWISDDGYITARYARNLLDGHGAVFNPGERVQGYTHPVWLLLMVCGMALAEDPLLVSVGLGVLLTFLTLGLVGRALLAACGDSRSAAAAFVAFAAVLASSESWRSFQTSGLENSLSHLLLAALAIETIRPDGLRVGRTSLLSALLVLTRPDFAVLVAPLFAYCAWGAWRQHARARLLAGASPLPIWAALAYVYYGSVMPNTAVTKLGVYTLAEGVTRGVTYVVDWTSHEPASLLAMLIAGVVAAHGGRRPGGSLLLLGVALHLAGVVVAGGDFMRGRMILPAFVAVLVLGTLQSAAWPAVFGLARARVWASALAVCFTLAVAGAPRQHGATLQNGISNERLFYASQSLMTSLRGGETWVGTPRIEPDLVEPLRAFARLCGRFAIHENRIGGLAYFLGPEVTVIDRLGLTDAYIARLPASHLRPNPRPGHPYRTIPVAYLASRADIRLFADWKDAVRAGDCTIVSTAHALARSGDLYAVFDPLEAGNQRRFYTH